MDLVSDCKRTNKNQHAPCEKNKKAVLLHHVYVLYKNKKFNNLINKTMKKFLLMIACAALMCACGGKTSSSQQPTDEAKSLEASSLTLRGKHANLFKVSADTYKVMLVQANDGWQVRIKVPIALKSEFEQLKDYKKYERELSSVSGNLLNVSEVELESLDLDESEWDVLLQEGAETETSITGKTWSYKTSYEDAKSIYDRVAAVELTGIELETVEESTTTTSTSSFEDDDLKEVKQTADDVKEILKAEVELINALGGFGD